jgi:hypothetical protein
MVLKATFCILRNVGDVDKMVPTLLSNHTLDLQVFFFKMTMCHNFKLVLCEENDSILLPSFGMGFLDL